MKRVFKFMVSVNSGTPFAYETELSLYNLVAIDVANKIDLDLYKRNDGRIFIKLWQESLIVKFGYISYEIKSGKSFLTFD